MKSMTAAPALLPLIASSTEVEEEEVAKKRSLDGAVSNLDIFLRILGFHQESWFKSAVSWAVFVLLGVALPLVIVGYSRCVECEQYEIKYIEIRILISQTLVAAISLLAVSRILSKHGTTRFLFVDGSRGLMSQFHQDYILKIYGFFRILAMWILPCLLIKTAREVVHVIYMRQEGSWLNATVVLAASIVSWTYCALLYLSGAALFHLVCSLQLTHFEYFISLLEKDLDISLYIESHTNLTHYLSKISHRFRIYLLLEFLTVSAFQFAALVDSTANRRTINFINSGDLAVCSIVQLVGIVLCLLGAAKISHRAHGLVSVASRWHAVITANTVPDSVHISSAPSHTTPFEKRQAFVTYLQSNFGGFTIYGWTIDRMLINTIFFLQFSLVLFVLGKTVTFRST